MPTLTSSRRSSRSTVAKTGMPARDYLDPFEEKVTEILDAAAPKGYEVSVAAVWNVSFDKLCSRSPAAHQLLQVTSMTPS
jgi:hypothetical protein